MEESSIIDEVIEKALEVAKANIEIEEDMQEISLLEKDEITENLINDEEIRGKALKKVIGKNDL